MREVLLRIMNSARDSPHALRPLVPSAPAPKSPKGDFEDLYLSNERESNESKK
jgi:hypothetical protein